MNIIEAINARKSIRGFKPDPVNQTVIKKILEAAVRGPVRHEYPAFGSFLSSPERFWIRYAHRSLKN
ncbi:MAG: nitroreductase family protein [Desulfobacterales bacterium]